MARRFREHSVLPGFGLTMGFSLLYLCLIVLIPLSATVLKSSSLSWSQFWTIVTEPRAQLMGVVRDDRGDEVHRRKHHPDLGRP